MVEVNPVVESEVRRWLNEVVIGLNLCPFARQPAERGRVRIAVSEAESEESLLVDLQHEMDKLQATPVSELETTLLVIPHFLQDFLDYNQFLDWVDRLIEQEQWEGVFQVATFYPHYCFAGAEPEDTDNLTNRAPYPILHIIREVSLARALEHYPNANAIPGNNMARMNNLSAAEKQRLFPYLFSS